VVEILCRGISITPRARIGAGLYIGHFGEVFVGEGA
jgi:serine acetyltransferase